MKTLLLASNGRYVIEKGMKLLFPDVSRIKLAWITTAGKGAVNQDHLERHRALLEKEGYHFEEIDIEGKMRMNWKSCSRTRTRSMWKAGILFIS